MKSFDITGIALYMTFGVVLTASGHSIEDITYWLLFLLLVVVDVRSHNSAYSEGLDAGSRITKEVWGIK